MDPGRPDDRVRLISVAKDPRLAIRRAGKDELLVLSRGERGAAGIAPESPALTVLSPDPAREPLVVPLESRFNALSQSDDGRYVITLFDPAAASGETLFNPNEIAIIDLAAPKPAPVTRALRSYGSVPRRVVFSPKLPLPDGDRTLAVVLSDSFVTLVDLDHPTRPEITVPLTLPEDHRTITPAQVLFGVKDPAIYVRTVGANDIYTLRLLPIDPAERAAGGNDFTPPLSQLAAGIAPADMALYDTADGPRLLVVSPGSHDAFVIDARTSRATRIVLADDASRIHLFEGTGPGDPKTRQRALLIGTGLDTRSISFLDLDQLDTQGARNLDNRPMGSPAAETLFFPARGLAVVLHKPQPSGAGVSVIDLGRRTVAPIFAEAPPARLAVGPSDGKIWVAAEATLRLGFIDLTSLAPKEVRLDAPVTAVLPLARAADGKTRVVAVHGNLAAGAVTILDGDKPDRATARAIEGFWLQDLLERGDR
jgi:hypothetical protein